MVKFLPSNPNIKIGSKEAIDAISAAPYGSSLVLNISYAYIKMLGADGLKKATEHAILNANYLKEILAEHFPILYANAKGRVAPVSYTHLDVYKRQVRCLSRSERFEFHR